MLVSDSQPSQPLSRDCIAYLEKNGLQGPMLTLTIAGIFLSKTPEVRAEATHFSYWTIGDNLIVAKNRSSSILWNNS